MTVIIKALELFVKLTVMVISTVDRRSMHTTQWTKPIKSGIPYPYNFACPTVQGLSMNLALVQGIMCGLLNYNKPYRQGGK